MTKLVVSDTDFMVYSMIERCPNTLMLRELVTNAIEACTKLNSNRIIKIKIKKHFNTNKLCIWNTGPGMSADELRSACDIASSINKKQGLRDNFGMGAKVASLKANKLGLRFRSCTDNKVSEVVMGQEIDPQTRLPFYTRFDYDKGSTNTIYPDVADITEAAKEEGYNLDEDWTEVVLYGDRDEQDTVKDPFNKNPSVPLRWIAQSLYHRFFALPKDVKITLEDGTNSRGGNRDFEPFHQRMERLSKKHKDHIRTETVKLENQIKIHYYFDDNDPSSGGHKYTYKGNVASDMSFAGIVYKNELYSVSKSNAWYALAPKLGIPFGARNLSVIVEIPNNTDVIPDAYRETIRWNDLQKDHVELEDYGEVVRNNIPEWFKKIIEKLSPKRSTSDDIKNHLKELLENLNVLTKTLKSSEKGTPSSISEDAEQIKHIREGIRKKVKESIRPPNRPLTKSKGNDKTDSNDDVAIPEFIPIRTEENLRDHPDLYGRAAKYVVETNKIFVNMLYESVKLMRVTLQKNFASRGNEDEVNEEIEKTLDDIFQIKIGSAVIYALSKRNKEDWDFETAQKAWSSETLSIIADFWQQDLNIAKDKLNQHLKKFVA